MRITVQVEPVTEPCKHGQGDGSTTYYAFRLLGLKDVLGNDLVVRSSEATYPGNEAIRNFINAVAQGAKS